MNSPSNFSEIKRAKAKDYERVDIEDSRYLYCSACDRKLLELVLVEQNSKKTEERVYQCNCPHCGDKSFKQRLTSSRVLVNLEDDLVMIDSTYDEEDGNILASFKLGKK